MVNKLTHDAERKAVEVIVDHVLSVKDPEDRKKSLLRLSYVMEKFFGGFFDKSSFEGARTLIQQGWQMVELRRAGPGYPEPQHPEKGHHEPGL
jgi:hypothetical protein